MNISTAFLFFSVLYFASASIVVAKSNEVPEACYSISNADLKNASEYLPRVICMESMKVKISNSNVISKSQIQVLSSNPQFAKYFEKLKLTHLRRLSANQYEYRAISEIVDRPGTNCEESTKITLELNGSIDGVGIGNITNQNIFTVQTTKLDSCHSGENQVGFKYEHKFVPKLKNNFYMTTKEFIDKSGGNSNDIIELLRKISPYTTRFLKASGIRFKFQDSDSKTCQLTVSARHIEGLKNIPPENDFKFVIENLIDDNVESITSMQSEKLTPGEQVIISGFPMGILNPLSVSVGDLLSEQESKDLFAAYSQKHFGDKSEFSPEIEYMGKGMSYQGFSGGPVFTLSGKWAGMLIRGFSAGNKDGFSRDFYFKFLKADYIIQKLNLYLEQNEIRCP